MTAKSTLGATPWATHGALFLVQIAFASQAVEAKLAMLPRAQGGEEILPEALAMIRMIGGALFFQAAVFCSGRWGKKSALETRISWKMHAKLIGLALLGIALNQALFLTGLRASTPFIVSILGATIPVLTAGLAVLFRKEGASWRTGLGLVLALTGVFWLIGGSSAPTPTDGSALGAVLVALNCLSYSGYVVFSRDVVLEMGSFRLMAWVFTYGALLFAPIGVPALIGDLPHLTTRGIGLLAYIVLIPTILAYGLNAWALGRSTASMVTIYIYLQPLIAGVLARLQLGYAVSERAGVATVLILAGVFVTTVRRSRQRASASR